MQKIFRITFERITDAYLHVVTMDDDQYQRDTSLLDSL